MAILESLNLNANEDRIYCIQRKEWVKGSPEERIRQHWISYLIHEWGFPQNLLAVEKSLSQFPHLMHSKEKLPFRRADIIAFAKGIHPSYELYPLLLIECKAVKLNATSARQAIGYNYYLRAPFIAIVNQQECWLGWHEKTNEQYTFIKEMLSYEELLKRISQTN